LIRVFAAIVESSLVASRDRGIDVSTMGVTDPLAPVDELPDMG
jgi:hypothetical protein